MRNRSIIILSMLLLTAVMSANAQTRRPIRKPTAKKPVAALNAGAVKTASGLTYLITKHGTGVMPKVGQTVVVHYTGSYTDGVKFDSSHDAGSPLPFKLGAGRVIKGWDEGIAKLHVGDQAIFVVPASLGYGPKGYGPIPPNATLIFIVELVDVKD